MAEEKKTRVIRSKEERKEEIEKKIEYHKACIKSLEEKMASIENGRRGGTRTKSIKRLINDAKLTDSEILKFMNVEDREQVTNRLNEIIEEKKKNK